MESFTASGSEPCRRDLLGIAVAADAPAVRGGWMLVAETVVAMGGLWLRCRLVVGNERSVCGTTVVEVAGGMWWRRCATWAWRYSSFHNDGLLDERAEGPAGHGGNAAWRRPHLAAVSVRDTSEVAPAHQGVRLA